MKNVLFATTALVAFAGAASAASHDSMSGATLTWSGEITAGYNDVIEGGLFFSGNISADASVDFGDNVTASLSVELYSFDDDSENFDADATVEVAYDNGNFSATLTMGDLNDKGASEYFYADRSGMAVDVENQDDDDDARAVLKFGDFGLAIGCEMGGSSGTAGTCDDGAYNVGLGATFGSIELGVGYDNAAGAQAAVTAVSADATFGSIDLGVSYATGSEDSIGVEVGATLGSIEVGAYYANNSTSNDEYGVSADYSAGALSVGAYYDNDGSDSWGLDLGYEVSDMLTASAGVFNDGTFVYYAGIEYTVNDNISATVSYATADEISGPEFKEGISAFITASF